MKINTCILNVPKGPLFATFSVSSNRFYYGEYIFVNSLELKFEPRGNNEITQGLVHQLLLCNLKILIAEKLYKSYIKLTR